MRVIDQHGGVRRELVLVGGSGPADVAHLHREALRVLRSDIDAAHLDAYSDDAWPLGVPRSYERVLSLAREAVANGTRSRRDDPGMGIDTTSATTRSSNCCWTWFPIRSTPKADEGASWSSAPATRESPCG
jgi:hypothetical protein